MTIINEKSLIIPVTERFRVRVGPHLLPRVDAWMPGLALSTVVRACRAQQGEVPLLSKDNVEP